MLHCLSFTESQNIGIIIKKKLSRIFTFLIVIIMTDNVAVSSYQSSSFAFIYDSVDLHFTGLVGHTFAHYLAIPALAPVFSPALEI